MAGSMGKAGQFSQACYTYEVMMMLGIGDYV